jgi:hypothetical protein
MTARKAAPKPAKPRKPPKPAKRKAAAKPAAKAKPARRKAPARKPSRPRGKAGPPGEPSANDRAVKAVERDLKRMPADVAKSAEAATALAMASRLDSGDGSPSECGKTLLQAMAKLREMTPPDTKKGALHGIKSGRALRLAPGGPAGPH